VEYRGASLPVYGMMNAMFAVYFSMPEIDSRRKPAIFNYGVAVILLPEQQPNRSGKDIAANQFAHMCQS